MFLRRSILTTDMDELLIFLLKKNAHKNPLRMTSSEIGGETGMSQQNASRRLVILEKNGKIKRRRCNGITITEKGLYEVKQFVQEMENALEEELRISGIVVSGKGEGRRFISISEYKIRINRVLGFVPFSGTLNIRLPTTEQMKRSRLLAIEPRIVAGFELNGKCYGDLYCYKCTINGINSAVVFPLKTRHGMEIIEIISPVNLRKTFQLREGSKITVVV